MISACMALSVRELRTAVREWACWVVQIIRDDLIDTLVFRNKYEIAISDILIMPVCFPKVNEKIKRNKARFHCLFAFRWIPNTKT